MYLDFYHLKKEPFHITPDPEFLYLSPSHKEAMGAIIYGIEQKKGFVAIIGAVGAGKTTILRAYLETADKKNLKIIYIFNARLTFEGVLKTIFQDLDLELNTNDAMEMVNKLYHFLIDEYQQGNNVVLVIDEAQNMPIETLENLRMLSNLETSKDKLIQIVLVGQPEFEESLNLTRLRQLKQRIAIRATIMPLTKEESLNYVQHRLLRAGVSTSAIFNKAALNKIVRKANGIPRVLNIICDNALITGFGYQQKPVGAKIVKEVIADMEGRGKQSPLKWGLAYGLSAVALAIGIFLAFHYVLLPSFDFTKTGVVDKEMSAAPQPKVSPKVSEPPKIESHGRQAEERPAPVVQTPATPKERPKAPVSTPASIESQAKTQSGLPDERPVAIKQTPAIPQERPKYILKPPAPMTEPMPKTVKRTDAPRKPIEEELSRSESALTQVMQEKNPQAVDPNLISSGSKIILPPAAGQ